MGLKTSLGMFIGLAFPAMAQESLKVSSESKRVQVALTAEYSYFSGASSLSGMGPNFSIRYAVDRKLGIGISMAQGLTIDQGLAALYSSFRSSVYWALNGSFTKENKIYEFAGRPMISVTGSRKKLVYLMGSFEQYLLNGTTQVFPATGFSISLGMELFRISNVDVIAELGLGLLVLDNRTSIPFNARLGGAWSF